MQEDFQLAWHTGDDHPEWGSAPLRPLVAFDMAHRGEWLDSVIGPDPVTGTPRVYHIVRCELCIAIHVWPLPSAEALAQYYATTFYEKDKPDYLERTERDRPWWEACVWQPLLEQCVQATECGAEPTEQLRLLDIGCGPAVSLDVAAKMGMETYGIEPNALVADRARRLGHNIYDGTLDTCIKEDADSENYQEYVTYASDVQRLFHIVTAYEVLEHQPEPENFLLRCYDLLRPSGILVVVVPNDYNPIQMAAQVNLGLAPWWLAPPQHLFHFSPKTLQLQIRRCGFTILDMRGTYPIDQALLHGRNYIGNDTLGRQVHRERMVWELDMLAKGKWPQVEAQYRANLQQRIGREIVCIARKEAL